MMYNKALPSSRAIARQVLLAQRSSRSSSAVSSRWMATAAAATPSTASSSKLSVPLDNIEASWPTLQLAEQEQIYRHLEELQKKDWKELSVVEKKAAYYIAFGPHGPRTPHLKPGQGMRTFIGSTAIIGAALSLFLWMRYTAPEHPKTMTKEWQEAMNQRAIEQKQDPFTGPSSEGYKGKGHIAYGSK